MCGISGYIGDKNAVEIVAKGLRTLEYRGYDSWGIATVNTGILNVVKDKGCLNHDMINQIDKSHIAIGHTRWATHGVASADNAHPHLSNDGSIAVVHNGIIDNYQELKAMLESRGYVFTTDTDTEVIPNLIQYYRNKITFIEACRKAFEKLKGQFAIVAIEQHSNEMIAIRKDAPLVIDSLGNYVASDVYAFLEYNKDIIFLEEMDMAIMGGIYFTIFNLKEKRHVVREVTTIDSDYSEVSKGDYDHYFIKEICEQTETIESLKYLDILNAIAELNDAEDIFITGCGSAAYAAIYGSYIFAEKAYRQVNFIYAHEIHNFEHLITRHDLLIAISQSGETADTIEAVRIAKSKGCRVLGITNRSNSTLSRESDTVIHQNAKAEICVLSTKSYTSQLAILTLLAGGNLDIANLKRHIYYLVSKTTRNIIKRIAEKLSHAEHIYLIGRGINYVTAMEAALKIKEVSYIHAEAFAGGELKHGSIALIEQGTPCIVFCSDNNQDIINNAIELKARGAYIIGVGSERNKVFDEWIKVGDTGDTNPICQIIPMQILAYQLALIRGCDPDKPRNLAKAVTVK